MPEPTRIDLSTGTKIKQGHARVFIDGEEIEDAVEIRIDTKMFKIQVMQAATAPDKPFDVTLKNASDA